MMSNARTIWLKIKTLHRLGSLRADGHQRHMAVHPMPKDPITCYDTLSSSADASGIADMPVCAEPRLHHLYVSDESEGLFDARSMLGKLVCNKEAERSIGWGITQYVLMKCGFCKDTCVHPF